MHVCIYMHLYIHAHMNTICASVQGWVFSSLSLSPPSHSLTHSLSHSLTHSLSHTHTHTLSLSSHCTTHTHTNSFSLSLSLSLSHPIAQQPWPGRCTGGTKELGRVAIASCANADSSPKPLPRCAHGVPQALPQRWAVSLLLV